MVSLAVNDIRLRKIGSTGFNLIEIYFILTRETEEQKFNEHLICEWLLLI